MPNEMEWEKTLRTFLPSALSLAVRLCGNLANAEDIVQDALVKIIQQRHTFRGESKVTTWMTRIVLNVARDWLRSHRRQLAFDEPQPTTDFAAAELGSRTNVSPHTELTAAGLDRQASDPLSEQIKQETVGEVRLAVDRLPQRQREVVQLLIWHDLPVSEVATILQITPQNVYANFHTAKQQLKLMLNVDVY